MVSLLLALTFVGRDPAIVGRPSFWLVAALSLALLVLFVRHERRVSEPVIDLTLVTRHPFSIVNLHNFLFGACVWGSFSFVPYFAAIQYGMGPLESGAVLTPRSIGSIVVGTIVSFLFVRMGYRMPIVVGLGLISLSTITLGQGWAGADLGAVIVTPFVLLAIINSLAGVGSGLVMPASNNAALDLLPDRAGVISGMRGMFRSIGGIIGTAVFVVILSLSEDQAAGLRWTFTAYGILLLTTIPLTLMIPDMPREGRTGSNLGGDSRARSATADARREAAAS
jgi:MFS family permease